MTKFSMTAAILLASASLISTASASTTTARVNFESGYSDDQVLAQTEVLKDENGLDTFVTLMAGAQSLMAVEGRGGDTRDGFVVDNTRQRDVERDTPASLGGFFLRTAEALNANLEGVDPVFSLMFAGGASMVSAQIWDIDGNRSQGTEQWLVTATLMDGSTQTRLSPLGNNLARDSLDGRPWDFSFTAQGNAIQSLAFGFVGSKQVGLGVAFDNLVVEQTAPIPLPATALMLLAGLGGLGALHGYRRAKT